MKKLILLLAMLLTICALPARADHHYDRDDYHNIEKFVGDLDARFTRVLEQRERFGSSPRIREELYRVDVGLHTVKKALHDREISPRRLHDDCYSLSDLLSDVEAQYRSRGYVSRRHVFGW